MANTLASYLEFSEADAVEQWRRVAQRVLRSRQEPFLPIEVLLSYALFFILNPHRFGKSNIHLLPEPVKKLALTLRRQPRSLSNKMLNLDGSLKNSARLEPQLFIRLAASPDLFQALYLRTLLAARAAGFGPEQVPDFLDALPKQSVELLGQDELGSVEIDHLLQEHREEVGKLEQVLGLGEPQTTRLVEQRARLGQHRFAAQVLSNYDHHCGFCGFAPRTLQRHGLLVASHIKPWARSDDTERLDPRNGIAACPMHDAAFDSGLITVNGGLRIHRAERLQQSMVADEGTEQYFGEQILAPRLKVVSERGSPDVRYLKYHIQNVFQGRLTGT